MAKDESAPDGAMVPITDGEPAVLSPQVIEAYESMIETVPDAGGGGFDSILRAIAAATDARDLDAPWRSEGIKELANAKLRVQGIRKMPSDFEGGLPWFLIIDAVIVATGEVVAVTTGALSVVAQLVKAWQLGAFPLDVVVRVAVRPSRNGYYPVHLEVAR